MKSVVYLGQFVIGASFALSAVSDFFDRKLLVELLRVKKVPLQMPLLLAAVILKFGTGVAIALDYYAPIAAYILALFILIANFIFHNFWSYSGPQAKKEYAAFMCHVALIGAMLMIIGC